MLNRSKVGPKRGGARAWLTNFAYASGLVVALAIPFVGAVSAQSADIPITVPVTSLTKIKVDATLPIGTTIDNATVPIVIDGFDPFQYVEIFVQSTPVLVASGFADAEGVFRAQVKLPAALELGSHSISAVYTKADGTKATLSVIKFDVKPGGVVGKPSKTTGGGSAGGTTGGSTGGAGGGGQGGGDSGSGGPTPSPTGTTDPTKTAFGGALYLSGISFESDSTFAPAGNKARVSITAHNATKNPLLLKMSVEVRNFLGVKIGPTIPVSVNLAGLAYKKIRVETSEIGQWGLYDVSIKIAPPKLIEGVSFTDIYRDSYFWVLPLFTSIFVWFALAFITVSFVFRDTFRSIWRRMRISNDAQGVD